MKNRRTTPHREHAVALVERHPGLLLERTLHGADRDRITCAGGTAPPDLMHALVAVRHGADLARKVGDGFMHAEVRPAGAARRGLPRGVLRRQPARRAGRHKGRGKPSRHHGQIAGASTRLPDRQSGFGLDRGAGAFCRDLRLERSRELLRQTDRPIPEIAIATGFSGAAGLATAWRKRFGEAQSTHRPEARCGT